MRLRGKARRRPRWPELLRLAWREGETAERIFVAYIACCVPLAVLGVAIITVASGVGPREAIWFWFVAFAGIISFPGFQGPIYDSAYSIGFLRATLAQNWLRHADREYYTELLRFRSTSGVGGRLKGDVSRATGYCVLYLINIFAGVFITVALYSVLAVPVGVVMTVGEWVGGILAGVAYSRRIVRVFRAAEAQGFRLLELKRATRRPSSA